MYEGTVVHYNQARKFGFIKPDSGGGKVFFHYSKGSIGLSARKLPVPTPRTGDRVRYNFNRPGDSRVNFWIFTDIKERLNTLTPAQQQLVQLVLGEKEAKEWEIWNAEEELPEDLRYEGREWYSAQLTGSGPRGTFYQVLLWARYWLAEHNVPGPALPRWPDMPRYTVRVNTAGRWNVINVPFYTRIEAEVFEQYLLGEGRNSGVRVVDIWPDAPPLSVDEAAKVLAECHRDVLKDDSIGDSEVSWIDDSWGQRTVVATGRFVRRNSWVLLDGHTYRGNDARRLQFCGPNLRAAMR